MECVINDIFLNFTLNYAAGSLSERVHHYVLITNDLNHQR